MEVFVQDVHYGVRMLLKSPLFTAVALTTIAIAIGANTAMFSLVDAILLRPLPYPEPQRLIVAGTNQRGESRMSPMGTADFLAWRDRRQSFEQVAVLDGAGGSFALSGMGEPERIRGVGVSANFFSIFGVAPLKGADFIPGKTVPGHLEWLCALRAIREQGLWVKPFQKLRACSDPDDDVFVERAQASHPDFLVAGNLKHFPSTCADTKIVTVRQFLDVLSDGRR